MPIIWVTGQVSNLSKLHNHFASLEHHQAVPGKPLVLLPRRFTWDKCAYDPECFSGNSEKISANATSAIVPLV